MRATKKDKAMTPATNQNEHVARRRVFDLDAFEKKTIEVKYNQPDQFSDPAAAEAFLKELEASKLVSLVNKIRNREALLTAKSSISGASPKLVNQMVNVFRMIPPYSDLIEKDSDGNATKESRTKQTQAIYAFIKSQPTILEGLKKQAEAAAQEEDDEDENDTDAE